MHGIWVNEIAKALKLLISHVLTRSMSLMLMISAPFIVSRVLSVVRRFT